MPTSITSSGITFHDTTTLATGVLPTANIADAAVTPEKLSQPYTLATSVASTSGTAIDFTGIPSWVKRITVMFDKVSTNGTSLILIRLGDGSVATSGYVSGGSFITGSAAGSYSSTDGILIPGVSAANARTGIVNLANITSNTWVASMSGTFEDQPAASLVGGGKVALSGRLDRVRITTVNGTDTFDAGTINISYEG